MPVSKVSLTRTSERRQLKQPFLRNRFPKSRNERKTWSLRLVSSFSSCFLFLFTVSTGDWWNEWVQHLLPCFCYQAQPIDKHNPSSRGLPKSPETSKATIRTVRESTYSWTNSFNTPNVTMEQVKTATFFLILPRFSTISTNFVEKLLRPTYGIFEAEHRCSKTNEW